MKNSGNFRSAAFLTSLFWTKRKTFQAGGGYKNPINTRKTISTTEIFPLWPPFFRQRKVLHSSRAVYAFFFPAVGVAKLANKFLNHLPKTGVYDENGANDEVTMHQPKNKGFAHQTPDNDGMTKHFRVARWHSCKSAC